jgi:hypothetical protein
VSYQRLPYDDAATSTEMTSDCRAVGAVLRLPGSAAGRRTPGERARRAAVRPAPSIRFEDYPREVPKPTIEVTEAASRLAAAIHPYLD